MKKALPTILIGLISIILLDCIGAIISRLMNFNYSNLLPFSLIIYTAIPFVIAKRVDKKTAIISAALLGFFDATIGWKLSLQLQANTRESKLIITPGVVIVTIVFVTILSTLLGLLGSWLALKFSINKKSK